MEENKKSNLPRLILIIVLSFITAIFVSCAVLYAVFNRITSPEYQERQIEKLIQKHEKDFEKFEAGFENHPFLPNGFLPAISLTQDNNAYRVIIDLKSLKNNENGIDVKIKDNVVSIKGQTENASDKGSASFNFSQVYYLDGKILTDKISKERNGDNYIITIPYKQ